MLYLFFSLLCCLMACEPASAPTQTPAKKIIQPLPTQMDNTDTLKPIFRTMPLQPLKTHIADWQASMKAGKALKIVCYGNSITHGYKTGSYGQVSNPYPQVLEKQLLARYPKASLQIQNEGHNGWRADQALQAVGKLVLPTKPDWVILELGINDAYSSFSPALYSQYMQKLVQTLKQNNIKVLLMTATPIATPYHEKVLAYHKPLRALAETEGCDFFDLATYIAQRAEAEKISAKELLPDEVHFADDKYAWIAEGIMTMLD